MREASFILPTHGNDGGDLAPVHAYAVDRLTSQFNGCTRTLTQGSWRSPEGQLFNDKGVRYIVAADWTTDRQKALWDIVANLCSMADQEAIYLVDDFGDVFLVDRDGHAC